MVQSDQSEMLSKKRRVSSDVCDFSGQNRKMSPLSQAVFFHPTPEGAHVECFQGEVLHIHSNSLGSSCPSSKSLGSSSDSVLMSDETSYNELVDNLCSDAWKDDDHLGGIGIGDELSSTATNHCSFNSPSADLPDFANSRPTAYAEELTAETISSAKVPWRSGMVFGEVDKLTLLNRAKDCMASESSFAIILQSEPCAMDLNLGIVVNLVQGPNDRAFAAEVLQNVTELSRYDEATIERQVSSELLKFGDDMEKADREYGRVLEAAENLNFVLGAEVDGGCEDWEGGSNKADVPFGGKSRSCDTNAESKQAASSAPALRYASALLNGGSVCTNEEVARKSTKGSGNHSNKQTFEARRAQKIKWTQLSTSPPPLPPQSTFILPAIKPGTVAPPASQILGTSTSPAAHDPSLVYSLAASNPECTPSPPARGLLIVGPTAANAADVPRMAQPSESNASAACAGGGNGGQIEGLRVLLERLAMEGIIRIQSCGGKELHPDLHITGFSVVDQGEGTERFKAEVRCPRAVWIVDEEIHLREVIKWYNRGADYAGPEQHIPGANSGLKADSGKSGGIKFSNSICQVFRRAGLVPEANQRGRGYNYDSFQWCYNADYRAKYRTLCTRGRARGGGAASTRADAAAEREDCRYHGTDWSPPSTPRPDGGPA